MILKDLCFEIIEKCTNNCVFCSSCSSLEKDKIIKLEDFKRVINYFSNKGGIEEISLSGGEPLLHPNVLEMIRYCNNENIKTTIYTSGVITSKQININTSLKSEQEIIKKLNNINFTYISKETFNDLKNNGLDKVVFDLQAIDVDNYNELMGTRNNISYVLKSIINAKAVGLKTELHFIPMKTNLIDINDILEIAEIGEIDQVSILKFVPQGRGRNNKESLQLTNIEAIEFMKMLQKQNIYNGNIRIGIPLVENDNHLCTAGMNKLSIRYDGAILPCPAFKELDYNSVKNIYENLEEIEMVEGNRKTPLCKSIYQK